MNFNRKSRGGSRLPRYTRSAKPSREWLALPFTTATVASGSVGVTQLLALEAPTLAAGTPVTSDPPEDLIVDRLIGWLTFSTNAALTVSLGLIVVDRTWTPIGTTTIVPDLDKRWLWWRQFNLVAGAILTPTVYTGASTVDQPNSVPVERDPTYFDIAPKVKIEDGKALCLVIYESGAASLNASINSVRMLLHRAGRR